MELQYERVNPAAVRERAAQVGSNASSLSRSGTPNNANFLALQAGVQITSCRARGPDLLAGARGDGGKVGSPGGGPATWPKAVPPRVHELVQAVAAAEVHLRSYAPGVGVGGRRLKENTARSTTNKHTNIHALQGLFYAFGFIFMGGGQAFCVIVLQSMFFI